MPRDIPDVYIDSPVVTTLRAAQARIRQAWIQRNSVKQYRPGVYAYCADAALVCNNRGRTIRKTPSTTAAQDALLLAIHKLTRKDSRSMSIVKFNDVWDRDKADVDQAYEVAVELQIRKEQGLLI